MSGTTLTVTPKTATTGTVTLTIKEGTAGKTTTLSVNVQAVITYDNNFLNNDVWGNKSVIPSNYSPIATSASSRISTEDASAKIGAVVEITMNANASWGGGVQIGLPVTNGRLTVGSTYTWSVCVKASRSLNLSIGPQQGGTKTVALTTNWQRANLTFVATDATYASAIFYITGGSAWTAGDKFYIANFDLAQTSGLNVSTANKNYNTQFGTLPTPSRTGYTFAGWYTAPIGGTQITTTSTTPNTNTTYYAHWTCDKHYLDLNGNLDGTAGGNITNFGTADVLVNGIKKGEDVSDFWQQIYYGSSYEINDIKAKAGKVYKGVSSGSLTGTMGTSNISVELKFNTKTNVTVPTVKTNRTYNGKAQSPEWNNYNTTYMTMGGTNSGTNAGTYTVTFTLKDTTNCQWADGTTAAKSVNWTMARARTASASAANKTYNGKAQTGVTGSNVSWSGTTSATNAGTYYPTATPTANYAWSDGGTGAKTITWTMARAKTASASAANKTYNGKAQTGVTGSNVSWSGTTSATKVGTYKPTATPTSNYAWSDGGTGAKTIQWTISAPARGADYSIGDQKFKVMSSSSTSLTLVPYYNITLTTSSPVQSASAGNTAFSTSNYWNAYNTNINMSHGNNLIQKYIAAYQTTLRNKGASTATTSVPRKSQITGSDLNPSGQWFWTGTSRQNSDGLTTDWVMKVAPEWHANYGSWFTTADAGVRPFVTLSI